MDATFGPQFRIFALFKEDAETSLNPVQAMVLHDRLGFLTNPGGRGVILNWFQDLVVGKATRTTTTVLSFVLR
jgi:hypothetical protein